MAKISKTRTKVKLRSCKMLYPLCALFMFCHLPCSLLLLLGRFFIFLSFFLFSFFDFAAMPYSIWLGLCAWFFSLRPNDKSDFSLLTHSLSTGQAARARAHTHTHTFYTVVWLLNKWNHLVRNSRLPRKFHKYCPHES